jgi:hypothetical protein
LATILLLFAAPGPGQSLGDAARQEAAKRAWRGESVKPAAFTDSDLAHSAGKRTEAVAASTPSQSEPAPKATSSVDHVRQELDRETEIRHQKERWWRGYAASVKRRFESAQQEYGLACGPRAIDLSGG